ncbi:hypothetical protein HPP92_009443 [Vanilla planifolia]|uniref:Protein SCAR n=1 Tax=Vanilla planifolia TaxID=51239 RepID=A0A835RBJ1_VANPL|nr:hypothetical protein HPP92_009443 [Vanilla planifolia]
MPLKRFELKNEYCLGDTKLYRGDSSKQEEDPRITLEGVAVSGLVGILRQLGDLAEFASVVFRDVHHQVILTAARGDKVLNRIQTIEEALPHLEKAVQEQKSHIHFAYIAGSIPVENLCIFDSAGAGACLKKYSDPSYFRRTVLDSESVRIEKAHNGMKGHRKKKQRPRRTGLGRHSMFTSLPGRREMDSLNSNVQLASRATDELSFSVDGTSISDSQSKSDLINEFTFSDLKEKRLGCVELQDKPSMSKKPYDPIPSKETKTKERFDCVFVNLDEVSGIDYLEQDSLHQQHDGKLMQTNDVSEGSLKDPNSAELLYEPSYQNYGMVDPVVQRELVCRLLKCDARATSDLEAWVKTDFGSSSATSKENAIDSPKERGKSLPSSPSFTSDEKAEIVEHSSSKLVDVGSNWPRVSDLFSLTVETSNKSCEIVDANMLIHDKISNNVTEMVVPSWVGSTYFDLRSGLDKHMDATDGFVSRQTSNLRMKMDKE